MQKFLMMFLFGLLFTAGAVAKDGPFPMYPSLGSWKSIGKTMEVQISMVKVIDRQNILVKVVAYTLPKKEIIASGISIHNINNPTLSILLVNPKGQRTQLILTPLYGAFPTMRKFDLNMSLNELDSQVSQSVPTKLIKD